MAPRKAPTPVPGADLPIIDETPPAEDLTAEAAEIFKNDLVDAPVVDVSTAARPVIAKLAQIMSSLPTLQPEGYNKHFGYNFIKDTQVSGAVRPRMARLGLMLIPDVEREEQIEIPTKNGKSFLTKLSVNFTIIDAETGDSVSGHGFGYGDDAGDKGANKALTAAEKYYLMKLFQIGGEDNESDESADKRASEREVGGVSSVNQVDVQGKQIDGIEKGGRSELASSAQINAITSTLTKLGWGPEIFVTFIDETLGDSLDIEGQTPGPIIKAYLLALSGDDAGKLLTAMMDAKDEAEKPTVDDGGGYGG